MFLDVELFVGKPPRSILAQSVSLYQARAFKARHASWPPLMLGWRSMSFWFHTMWPAHFGYKMRDPRWRIGSLPCVIHHFWMEYAEFLPPKSSNLNEPGLQTHFAITTGPLFSPFSQRKYLASSISCLWGHFQGEMEIWKALVRDFGMKSLDKI